ncbi:MAG: type II toxin-antitoxin system VapC family toxin [Anaerolineales bacterium]|nr:type II toxin-antitoxin system VapC family toxin [Anaerolineales bacterium]
MNWLAAADGEKAVKAFRAEWPSLLVLQVTASLAARADSLAWQHGLRADDAMHLAAALLWQEALGEEVTVATFDKQLWPAAGAAGLAVWPASLE